MQTKALFTPIIKPTLLALTLAFSLPMSSVMAHDLANTSGATWVASYDLSGTEIWNGYFLPEYRLLAVPRGEDQRQYKFINHPPYNKQNLPAHRQVCELSGRPDNDAQDRCKDEFPHVHIDDFKMALNLANDICASYGASVVPQFTGPGTFAGFDNTPALSHHYHYALAQGIQFDCVALAVE
ncbi:hypothetical protein OS175_00190 [Marinicella sp. S1101]|nr:hypothetical protein [Marinicella marina]MCX7552280.1 hypothetical protein [Marinicella marina]MDJ1139156.1 hypothetical protein [Marinicella marina]